VTGAPLAAGWAGFVPIGDSWWQLAVATFLAVVFTQVGFLAHAAGRKQMFTSRRASRRRRDPAHEPGRRSGLLVFLNVVNQLILFVATLTATSAAGPTTALAAPGTPRARRGHSREAVQDTGSAAMITESGGGSARR